MKIIGLVGGVASGKSQVAKLLADEGAIVLDADRSGHDVLSHDPEVKQALVARWGSEILAADGTPDRGQIAARVFASNPTAAAERQFLESQLHPRIRAKLEAEAQCHAAAGCPALVLDAPLLLEAGWGPMCDLIVMVNVSRDIRLVRARQRGWEEAEFNRREAAQWPTDQKRQHADAVLTNEGSLDELRTAVRQLWHTRIAGAARD